MLKSGAGYAHTSRTFTRRLDEAAWSQNLRDYLERLLRTGEVTTYEEALTLGLQHIILQPPTEEPRSIVTENSNAIGVPHWLLPRQAMKDAAHYIKNELTKVVKTKEKK